MAKGSEGQAMKDRIDEILMEMAFLDEPPGADDSLKDDLGFDSLRMVELIVAIEDEFGIIIGEDDLDPGKITSVRDIHDLVGKYGELNDI